MSNVLSDEKKQQVIALGNLGWSLRRIEQATGVRRETVSVYLRTAGVEVCLPGWGRRALAKPAIQVTTDSGPPDRSPSACEPCRELIEQGLARGRNAMALWQDLVSNHGFGGGYQTVKRFVASFAGWISQRQWALSSPLPERKPRGKR
jgi:transposase